MNASCWLLGMVLWAGAAPVEQAATHYDLGVAAFDAGDFEKALREFEAAYAAVPRFEPLRNVAVAHRKLGHMAAAYRTYLRYLNEGGDQVPAKRRAEVTEELLALDRLVAHVTVAVPVDGADVEIDGVPVGQSPVRGTQHLEPGRHVLRASFAGSPDAVESRQFNAGETTTLTLPLRAPASRVVAPVQPEPPSQALRLPDDAAAPKLRLHIETDNPKVELFQIVGTGYGYGSNGAVAITQTRSVCLAPCKVPVEASGRYFFSGDGVSASSPFTLETYQGQVTAKVKPGSSAMRFGGFTAVMLGGIALITGAIVFPIADAHQDRGLADAGIGMIAAGGAVLAAGIPLMVFSSTDFELLPETTPRASAE